MPANELKPGSLRYFDEEIGVYVISEPGSKSYSSTAMSATEFLTDSSGCQWTVMRRLSMAKRKSNGKEVRE